MHRLTVCVIAKYKLIHSSLLTGFGIIQVHNVCFEEATDQNSFLGNLVSLSLSCLGLHYTKFLLLFCFDISFNCAIINFASEFPIYSTIFLNVQYLVEMTIMLLGSTLHSRKFYKCTARHQHD